MQLCANMHLLLLAFLLGHSTAVDQLADRGALVDEAVSDYGQPVIDMPLQKVTNERLTSILLESRTPVPLRNFDNTQYIGSIYVGTPAKKFDVIFDTGSANTWVYSETCQSPQASLVNKNSQCSAKACSQHVRYSKDASSSHVKNGTGIEIKYGSGTVQGTLFKDLMSFGTDPSAKKLDSFFMLEANCVNAPPYDVFDDSPFDGVMGLGFENLGIKGTTPVMEALLQKQVITENQQMFSFFLTSNAGQEGSRFTIGGVNNEHKQGDLVWHPVIGGAKHWSLKMSSLKVGDWKMDIAQCSGGCPAVPDTGTSLMTGPEEFVKQILAQSGEVKADCSNFDQLKPISFELITDAAGGGGRATYKMEPSDYVLQVTENGKTECFDGIYGMDMPAQYGKMFILGDVFLAKYLTVFDIKHKRVGIALSTASKQLKA